MDQTNRFCFHLAIEHGFSGPVNVLSATNIVKMPQRYALA